MTGYELLQAAHGLLAEEPGPDATYGDQCAWLQRVCEWADGCDDKIAAYKAVHKAASRRRDECLDRAATWASMAGRHASVATRTRDLATLVLQAIRDTTGERKVTLADGEEARLQPTTAYRVDVLDVDALPAAYVRVTTAPDKAAIKGALRAGAVVDGAALVAVASEHIRW